MPEFNVQNLGASATASPAQNTDAFERSGLAAYVAGGGTIIAPPVPNGYALQRVLADGYAQKGGCIRLRKGVSLRGEGTKLLLRDNCAFITNRSPQNTMTPVITIAGDVHRGDTRLVVDGTTLLGKGSRVFFRVGNSGMGELAESRCFGFASIREVADATHVTLDRPVLTDMAVATTTPNCRTLWLLDEVVEGVSIEGFNLINDLVGGTDAEAGIDLFAARQIEVSRISGSNPGAGLLTTQFTEGIDGRALDCPSSVRQYGHPSKGRVLTISSSTNVSIDGVGGADFEDHFGFIEFFSDTVQLRNVSVRNTLPGRDNLRTHLFLNQTSLSAVEGLMVAGNAAPLITDGGVAATYGLPADCRFRNVSVNVAGSFTWPASAKVDGYYRTVA